NGHGTHVAATAAGSRLYNDPTHGFFTQEGVAPRSQIMAAKFLSAGGSGSFEDAISALQWSFDNGADVTSNSWGASCGAALAAIQAVRTLTDLGMLSVFAAGGSGPGPGTVGGPACGESALSAGAVDQNRVIAPFSGRGPCSDPDTGTPPRTCPDLVAKGVTVTSAWPRPAAPTGYRTLSGTSMAAPFVAGAAVLSEQMKREITGTGWDTTARAEEAVFKRTSLDLGTAGPDNNYGWGLPQLLNIYALLANQDVADIVDTFEITLPLIREDDTTTLSFAVVNAGGAVASGPFRATLTDPTGAVTVLRERDVALGFLDGETLVHPFTAGPDDVPGTYTFRGTFDYTWTDVNGDPQEGHVNRSGTFDVKRIVLDATLDGFEATAPPLVPQRVEFEVTNAGNEDAANLVITIRVPNNYLFAPGANVDPTDLATLYSDPAPDAIVEGDEYTTLVYRAGTLEAGQTFSFTSTLLAKLPGAFAIRVLAEFEDGASRPRSSQTAFEQTVRLPT
ncbi:MAG: S8 family serine peptidase, partial [Actinomycetota bacterium]